MDKMAPMKYEYILCRAYNCGRGGVDGADADIYREYSHAVGLRDQQEELKEKGERPISGKSDEELEQDVQREAKKVCGYLQGAIDKIINDHSPTTNQKQRLQGLRKSLEGEDDRERIEDIMAELTEVENAMGLTMK